MIRKPWFLKGVCKDYLWGGQRLKTLFEKESDAEILAESWELSCHPDGCAVIASGEAQGCLLPEMIARYGVQEILGSRCSDMAQLPLIKLIDAREALSVQVHPDDAYARAHGDANGKTEMWYVLDAEDGAELVYGVNTRLTQEELRAHVEQGTLDAVMRRVPVKKGDVFFIPSGTLHAIGKGILIAEVQQCSNLTYRVYDYNRRDAEGNLRPLHIADALAVTNCMPTDLPPMPQEHCYPWGSYRVLSVCPHFAVVQIAVHRERSFETDGKTFRHLLILEGEGRLYTDDGFYPLKKGDSVLLPSKLGYYCVSGFMQFLQTSLPDMEEYRNFQKNGGIVL